MVMESPGSGGHSVSSVGSSKPKNFRALFRRTKGHRKSTESSVNGNRSADDDEKKEDAGEKAVKEECTELSSSSHSMKEEETGWGMEIRSGTPTSKECPLSPVIERVDSITSASTSGNSTSSQVLSALLGIVEPRQEDEEEQPLQAISPSPKKAQPPPNLPQTKPVLLDMKVTKKEAPKTMGLAPSRSVQSAIELSPGGDSVQVFSKSDLLDPAKKSKQNSTSSHPSERKEEAFLKGSSTISTGVPSTSSPDSSTGTASTVRQGSPADRKEGDRHSSAHPRSFEEEYDDNSSSPSTPQLEEIHCSHNEQKGSPEHDTFEDSPVRMRQPNLQESPYMRPPTTITAPPINLSPLRGNKPWESYMTTPHTASTYLTSTSTINSISSNSMAMAAYSMTSGSSRKKTTADVIRTDIWSREPSVVLTALQHIAADSASEKSRSLIARTGGLLAVVRAMETHSAIPKIQIYGCQALEKLALDADNEVAIEQVGGVDAVIAAMMGHFNHVGVQEAAWAALWNLTCTNAMKEMGLDNGFGMQRLVSAMQEHIDSPSVQKNACGAMANLCGYSPKRLEAFSQANGFMVLSLALTKYWNSDPEVRAEACFAMTALCEVNATASRATSSPAFPTISVPTSTVPSIRRTFSADSVADESITSSRRGYLPRRFAGRTPVQPSSMLQTGKTRTMTHTRTLSNDDSDLRSLDMSYFDEETIIDDRSMAL